MMDMGFLIPTFLLNSALPLLSKRDSEGGETKSMLGKTFLMMLILGSIAALFAMLWPRPIVELLTTNAYLSTPSHPGSDTALALQALPMFLNGIILFSFYVLLTRHAWKRLVAILGLGAALSVTLNLLLIPPMGFLGACVTSIVVSIFLACVLLPTSIFAMSFRIELQTLLGWGVFTVLFALLLFSVHPFLVNELITASAGVLCTLIGFALLWGIGLLKSLQLFEKGR